MSAVPESSAMRLAPLDALRGIAALSVVFWHYRSFGATPAGAVFSPLYQSGGYAVSFFFLLSGYVLAHVYMPDKRRFEIGRNIAARFFRMGPLHYATLIFVACAQLGFTQAEDRPFVYTANDVYHFLLNLFLLQESGLQRGYSFNGPSWSISVEILINIVFMLLIATRSKRAILSTFFILFVLSYVALLWSGGDVLYSNAAMFPDRLLLVGFANFFQGALLYLCSPPSRPRTWVFDVIFAATLALTMLSMAFRPLFPELRLDLALTLILFPALIVGALRGSVAGWALSVAPLRWLGYISFSLYLTHFPLQCVFHAIDLVVPLPFTSPLFLGFFFATATTVAWIVAKLFEWPIYRAATGRMICATQPPLFAQASE